ncbi:MAG: DUF1501 domain-containing protein [Planctomycetes bacterium]|nr:DUF1501 domain-containing protein [Planctomycetota bacterium]
MRRHEPSRRDLLRAAAALPVLRALPAFGRAWHASAADDERVLVVVQLTGANDGLNTVVPYGDDRYHRARPVLALDPARLVRLDDHTGLHPALAALEPLWDEGRLTVVQGVGLPVPDRSHFRAMEIWHTASLAETPPSRGWIGAFADGFARGGALPVARLGGRDLPLALAGAASQAPAIEKVGDLLLSPVGDGSSTAARSWQTALTDPAGRSGEAAFLAAAYEAAFGCARRLERLPRAGDLPGGALGRAFDLAARVLGARLGARVLYLTHGGFDTHARQADTHADLLRELGDALAGFDARLRAQGDAERVTVLVFSEFGRRVAENASQGTDHGAGAPVLLCGAPLRGGLLGSRPDLAHEDGDVPTTCDFRRVYATLLEWLGVDVEAVLAFRPEPLPLFA